MTENVDGSAPVGSFLFIFGENASIKIFFFKLVAQKLSHMLAIHIKLELFFPHKTVQI